MVRLTLAWLHLAALGIGLGAVWSRGRAARGALGDSADTRSLARVFAADTWWGVAAVLWIATGFWRLFAGSEKPTAYYLHNHVFFAKMGLLVAVLALEAWPMATLIRWRMRKTEPTARNLGRIEIISYAEVVLAAPAADATHPAFSNLFVQTEIIESRQAIVCTRRDRFGHRAVGCRSRRQRVASGIRLRA